MKNDLLIHGRESELSFFASDDLARAVMISLFSWARAHDDDQVDGSRRHGFWGDAYADAGEVTGSRLWLLCRQKITPTTIERARQYAAEALEWLVSDGVADAVEVTAERGALDRVDLAVTVTRNRDSRTLRFEDVWRNLNGL